MTSRRIIFILFQTLCVIMISCTSYHPTEFTPRHLGWQAAQDLAPYVHTDSVLAAMDQIRSPQAQADSLLKWTDMLNFQHEEAALAYANELYRLAVEKGFRFSQALGMYYRALLKGRKQIQGQGIDDALTDARICLKIMKSSNEPAWLVRANGLFGHLYYEKSLEGISRQKELAFDSAVFYLNKALQISQTSKIPDGEFAYLQGQIFLDLANTYTQHDSSLAVNNFQQSIETLSPTGNTVPLACSWRDLGIFYLGKGQFEAADSALSMSKTLLETTPDEANLMYTYQRLADLKGLQYQQEKGTAADYEESMAYLRKTLSPQNKNIYYTYLLIAYTFSDKFYKTNGDPATTYSPEGDSVIKYFQLAIQEAKKEGVVGVIPNLVENITISCELRTQLTGASCNDLLEGKDFKSFLNYTYSSLLDTIRNDLKRSNTRIRNFEKTELETTNNRRVRNIWLISGGALLFALMLFLISLQQQQKKRLQAQMQALRAQINPHFISNSLNAIENLVIKNERAAAAKYLVHFSRLSRKILTSSRDANTSLAEEIQTLKHFLALEQLRFNNKLDVEIEVDPALETEKIEVPGLILQPYAENAIWHGIKPKKGRGVLKVHIRQDGKHLLCIIEDDGVGRKKAQQIKEQSVLKPQHTSQGMKITEERLRAFAKVKGFKVDIQDKYAADGTAAGTRVLLRLPIRFKKN